MINYEIEYVLRPVSAPIRFVTSFSRLIPQFPLTRAGSGGGPRLRTNRRARSSRPDQRGRGGQPLGPVYGESVRGQGGGGYPRVVTRASSEHSLHQGVARPVSRSDHDGLDNLKIYR